MRAMKWLFASLALAGCWRTTTSSTATEAEAVLRCLDCDEPVAVGLPIRVHASWVGTCTKSGKFSELRYDRTLDTFEWETRDFTTTKACDEHRFKLDVTCSAACVVRSIDSPETSTQKVLFIYPEAAGPFRFDVAMRAPKAPTSVRRIGGEVVVRTPDLVSFDEERRPFAGSTRRAAFGGYEYDLVPPRDFGDREYGIRGTRPAVYAASEDDRIDRLERTCFARTPGAALWRPCASGVVAGDDVRIDVVARAGGEIVDRSIKLASVARDEHAWTCYHPVLAERRQVCVRYEVPAGMHELRWQAKDEIARETLVVGAAR